MWWFCACVCGGAARAGCAPGEAGEDVDHFVVLQLSSGAG